MFLYGFEGFTIEQMAARFAMGKSDDDITWMIEHVKQDLEGATIHLAAYDKSTLNGIGQREWDTLVVFEKDDRFYVVEGYHAEGEAMEYGWESTPWDFNDLHRYALRHEVMLFNDELLVILNQLKAARDATA